MQQAYLHDQQTNSYRLSLRPISDASGEKLKLARLRQEIGRVLAREVIESALRAAELNPAQHYARVAKTTAIVVDEDGKIQSTVYADESRSQPRFSLELGKTHMDLQEYVALLAEEQQQATVAAPAPQEAKRLDSITEERVVDGIKVKFTAGGQIRIGGLDLATLSPSEKMHWGRKIGTVKTVKKPIEARLSDAERAALAAMPASQRLREYRRLQQEQST